MLTTAPQKDKKSYDTGFYTINEGFGTFHGTLKKEDIPEEEKPVRQLLSRCVSYVDASSAFYMT